MKIYLKNKNGATTVDLTIAMIAILIFVTVMTSVSYNAYSSGMEAKRSAIALNYAVDIFEHIGELDYSDVKASNSLLDIEALKDFEYGEIVSSDTKDTVNGKIGTYNIRIDIEDYKAEGVIKIITLTITYSISRDKEEKLELQRLKVLNS